MLSRTQLRPAHGSAQFDLVRAEIPCPELNRFLYTAVGAAWWWYDRLPWNRARWLEYLDRPELETWVAYISGTPRVLRARAPGRGECGARRLRPASTLRRKGTGQAAVDGRDQPGMGHGRQASLGAHVR